MRWSHAARALAGGFFSALTSAASVTRAGMAAVLLALLSSCATPLQSTQLDSTAYPAPVELTTVPFFPQEEYQCGPAALAMALTWAGVDATPATLTPQVYLPERRGSLQLELLANARRYGAIPYVLRPELKVALQEVAAGNPVVVLQNLGLAWYPKWHYAVLVGFDTARDQVVLRSGLEARHLVSFTTFERTWRRGDYWAMVVMPPTRVPTTAEETPYLQAVATLERLQHWQETSSAYRTALDRWPRSAAAAFGLGNSRYALGDLAGAEAAYRTATTLNAALADGFNNLAQVLAEQKKWREAETAIARALELGGPRHATYESTKADIVARRMK